MFRWTEDEFLRKGDYSRNCLTFEEEEEAAKRLALASNNQKKTTVQALETVSLAHTVYVSAGGECTEPLVRAIFEGNGTIITWKRTELGVLGKSICLVVVAQNASNTHAAAGLEKDGKLAAFIAPSRWNRLSPTERVDLERAIAKYLIPSRVEASANAAAGGGARENTRLVVFATLPPAHYDYSCRILSTSPNAASSIKTLERGRLVTGLPSALLERALVLRDETATTVTCCFAPRDAVLASETLHAFLLASQEFIDQEQYKAVKTAFPKWSKQALVRDEAESRLSEPEGMFL